MQIDVQTQNKIRVLSVRSGRIDAAGAMMFKEEVRQRVKDFDGRVIMDLQDVEFLDSSGLGALVAVMKMLGNGRRLELAHCGELVRKVLKLTRMDSVFVLHETLPSLTGSAGPHSDQDAA